MSHKSFISSLFDFSKQRNSFIASVLYQRYSWRNVDYKVCYSLDLVPSDFKNNRTDYFIEQIILRDVLGSLSNIHVVGVFYENTLREKCPYSKFFWSVFSRIWTEYGEILPYSVQMRENKDQKNSEYGHFSCSDS